MLNLFKKFLIITIFTAALPAQSDRYIGSSYSMLEFDSGDLQHTNDELDSTAIGLVVGSDTSIYENLAAEIRLAGGMFGSKVAIEDESINVDLKYYYGAYLKYNITSKDNLSPYAILGYTRSKVVRSREDDDPAVGEDEESEIALKNSDISYGLGFDYALNDSSLINFEYVNYIDSGNASISAFSLGIKELF